MSPAIRRLHTLLTFAAILTFAWLTTRHVGEAAFLEDQVDQLQNFESLLRLRPEGLWGAIMSGTVPPAHALGPLGAVVFGIPVSLGLGVDAVHLTTSLLIAIGTAALFTMLLRVHVVFAWVWFVIFTATGVVWWNAAMLWSNTLLLPLGLAIATLTVSCLRRPSLTTLAWLAIVELFALQLHLVAVVAVPVIAIVTVLTYRDARLRMPSRGQVWILGILVIVAIGPYVIAEAMTGFRNTRAIATHLDAPGTGAVRDAGSATMSLLIAEDPTRLLERAGFGFVSTVAIGGVLSGAALVLLGARLRRRFTHTSDEKSEWVLFWLTVCAVTAIAGQAIFFLWMSRPFAGLHHVTLLAPLYAVVPAVLIRLVMARVSGSMVAACALGSVALIVLAWAGPAMADRFAERTPWSYAHIVSALDALCGDGRVETHEGQGFAAQLNPQYDSVLRYLMKRRYATCHYEPGSDILIVAGVRDQPLGSSLEIGQARYRLELVLPPGIARYRKEPR